MEEQYLQSEQSKKKRIKELIPKMKQRIYTKNEAKNLYQKLSKEDESYQNKQYDRIVSQRKFD